MSMTWPTRLSKLIQQAPVDSRNHTHANAELVKNALTGVPFTGGKVNEGARCRIVVNI